MAGSEIGRKLRQLRLARGKSLSAVAGLAGISPSYLSRLESGERALDRRSLILGLADALDVAPSEITGSVLVIPGERDDDRALNEVRLTLLAVSMDEPHGEAQPVEQLTARVTEVLAAQNDCRSALVGTALPSLIRDLHTAANAHRDEREVLRLLTLAHMQCTQAWLTMVGAPLDLSWQAATLARHAAAPLVHVAANYLNPGVGTAVNAAGVISAFGAQLACVNAASRLLYALGREMTGTAGRSALTRISRRSRAPIGALAVVAIASVATVLQRGESSDDAAVQATQQRLLACFYAMAHPETGQLVPACVQHSVLDPGENARLRRQLPIVELRSPRPE